jgi:hypothetical protein
MSFSSAPSPATLCGPAPLHHRGQSPRPTCSACRNTTRSTSRSNDTHVLSGTARPIRLQRYCNVAHTRPFLGSSFRCASQASSTSLLQHRTAPRPSTDSSSCNVQQQNDKTTHPHNQGLMHSFCRRVGSKHGLLELLAPCANSLHCLVF